MEETKTFFEDPEVSFGSRNSILPGSITVLQQRTVDGTGFLPLGVVLSFTAYTA